MGGQKFSDRRCGLWKAQVSHNALLT